MASHELIEAHLSALGRVLPAAAVEELADGFAETWHRYLADGLTSADAARAAIAEFGSSTQIIDAFVTHAPGRSTARLLLATGPIAGLCWGAGLITAHAWNWPVPRLAAVLLGTVLLLAVAALLAAATSRHSYGRTRLAIFGGIAVLAIDATMLTAAVLVAPLQWPMLPAVALSLARLAMTTRLLPGTLAYR